jgi:hypothetical protein
MDNLILFTYTIGREEQSVSASLVMVTLLVSAATAAGGVVPFAIVQEEGASLGEGFTDIVLP